MSSASQEEVASGSASSDPIPKFDMHTITSVLTEEQGTPVAEGDPIEQHVTEPLAVGVPIPRRTDLQKIVEHADQRVLDAREKKERKKQDAPPRPASKKRPAGESSGRGKKRAATPSVVELSGSDASENTRSPTRSPSPINVSHPNIETVDQNLDESAGHNSEQVVDRNLEERAGHNAGGGSGGIDGSVGPNDDGQNDEEVQGGGGGEGVIERFPAVQDPPDVENLAHGGLNASTSSGSTRQAFGRSTPGGPSGSSEPFIPSWNLTAGASLNDAEACREMMVHLPPPSVRAEQAFGRRTPGGPSGSSEPFIPSWNLTAGASLNDAKACREMMVHLPPPSVRAEQVSLTDYQATQRAWFELARCSLAQADALQRFENLSYHYAQLYQAHQACGASVERLTTVEASLAEERRVVEGLTKANRELHQQHQGCSGREADLAEQLSLANKEKEELSSQNLEQSNRIKQLEDLLAGKEASLEESERKSAGLAKEVEKLTVASSQAEILRHNYVRQLIPTVVKRFRESDEYQMAWAGVFNAALDAGWLAGLKLGRSEEEVAAYVAGNANFDMAGVESFQADYDEMFVRPFPYIERVASSFRLPLADIMNILPAGEENTVGAGASGQNPSEPTTTSQDP
ncbi:transposase (putative), gypsy type [Artemisia annua]|uniref:Transposase (Putative), gypsy type n=1 Tax=Artemisia annua TaxID=35608 RepID=A0A2U1MW80_ARTAN|nr:transposase (putative), gypsy type [Artemisia annua]